MPSTTYSWHRYWCPREGSYRYVRAYVIAHGPRLGGRRCPEELRSRARTGKKIALAEADVQSPRGVARTCRLDSFEDQLTSEVARQG